VSAEACGPDHVPSPCINVCSMDERTGLCAGCYRTLEEIAQWSAYTPEQQRAVRERLRRRHPAPPLP
jgi:uncharacterized protein